MLIIYAICKADLATPASAQLTSTAVVIVGIVVRFTISSCQFVIAFVALTVKLCVDCGHSLVCVGLSCSGAQKKATKTSSIMAKVS